MSGNSSTVPARPPWQIAVALVCAALLALGVGVLIARAAGFAEVRDAIAQADPTWFALCLVAQVAALASYAEVVRGALRRRGRADPGFGLSAHVALAGIGAARVFAPGGVGALAATYWCFRRAGLRAWDALVAVLGSSALFYVSFGIGAWLAAVVAAVGDVSPGIVLPWLVVVPVCGALALLLTRAGADGVAVPASGSLARRGLAVVVAALVWVREALGETESRAMVIASVLFWIGNLVCFWAALRSVGITVPLAELVLAYATGHAATIVPLPLGGAGGVDAALTYALTVVGVALAPALVGVAVYRLFAFWAPTVPALVALVLLPRAGRRLEAVAAARSP